MGTKLVVIAILSAAPFALWGCLCALNAMRIGHGGTRPVVALSFLLIAWGWGAMIFAALDFLLSLPPQFWPDLLLFAVLCLAAGNAALFLFNRRACRCTGCPGAKALRRRQSPPPAGAPTV